jgi:hypothetical protein
LFGCRRWQWFWNLVFQEVVHVVRQDRMYLFSASKHLYRYIAPAE